MSPHFIIPVRNRAVYMPKTKHTLLPRKGYIILESISQGGRFMMKRALLNIDHTVDFVAEHAL